MRGAGTLGVGNQKIPVTFELQRRARQDVVQHQVEQRAEVLSRVDGRSNTWAASFHP